jgi:hypothetical protein
VRDARRRVFYQARAVAQQMGDEIDAADDAGLGVEPMDRAGAAGEEVET